MTPAALLLAAVVTTGADWRPPLADGLAELDADMAPILSQYQEAFEAVASDYQAMGASWTFTGVAAAATDMQARLDAAERFPKDIAAELVLAHDAMAVLDRHQPDPCWADYAADLRTGWLLYGDAAQSLQVGDIASSSQEVGTALYLLGPRGDLLHAQAVKDCAA